MRKIQLNFKQEQSRSGWQWLGILLLILVISLNGLLIYSNQKTVTDTNALLAKIDLLKKPQLKVPVRSDDIQSHIVSNQYQQASLVAKQLNLPWGALFETLEKTKEKDIDLLSVSSDANNHEILLTGQADSLSLIFDYVTRLKKSTVFSNVELRDQQKIVQNGTQRLQFTLVAEWISHHD